MPKGSFTISLDFELLWGIFDKIGTGYKPSYFLNTRQLVPIMLEKFAAANIQTTRATVGMLFAENEEEWKSYSPKFLPSYRDRKYSAYEWVKKHGIRPEVHFAPELIQQVIDTPGQELGSHTFAHYYTLMRGQSPEQFREDLKATQRISQDKFGVSLESLVFPRNHINELYLGVCLEEGYKYVRGNPRNWFWQETQHENLSKKIFRSADCFFKVGARTSYPLEEVTVFDNEPLIIPASRILRPQQQYNMIMNKSRLARIKSEMEYAAKHGEVYHLWWHPHNFGASPESSLAELDDILTHYKNLNAEYGMQSLNMRGIGELVNKKQMQE
ncbi:polysaccharide deacetylase family protein [Algoriphagus sp. C2-6-M1]|uniref:polysaccharide deacetylase family protein n=1 Tax=Algoriphagus persicinus TaxID=3108754 RepID=UPI002B363F0B|nr:polysaccharide deacetylase family protein [Algoriphagus sp. C2-6-M1]MEB2782686.1 polysaccharide deacetylase family protein [Algoriphagus sp. C2-6-M1]